jgi:hypothetical protein
MMGVLSLINSKLGDFFDLTYPGNKGYNIYS